MKHHLQMLFPKKVTFDHIQNVCWDMESFVQEVWERIGWKISNRAR
jgi:hypothetical protein